MHQLSLSPESNLDELIQDVLMGRVGPWPLGEPERALLHILRYHKGAANPVQLNAVVVKLGLNARKVKELVKELIENFGIPIGGSRQEPFGYFLVVTAEDLECAVRPLANEVISLARRMRKLGGLAIVRETLGQLRTEMEP